MEQRTFTLALQSQLARGRSKSAIGRDLGLSHDAIRMYVAGTLKPSRTVLLLAELLWGGRQAGEWPAEP